MKTKKASHTPGPWLLSNDGLTVTDGVRSVIVETPEQAAVRNILPPAEQKANARLIAMAPDLLEAAKEAESMFLVLASRFNSLQNGEHGYTQAIIAAGSINAVIAKAEQEAG